MSPAFDINPIENSLGLTLNISLTDNSLVTEIAPEVAKEFRVSSERAKEILKSIQKSVSGGQIVAEKYKIPKTEERICKSFKVDDKI